MMSIHDLVGTYLRLMGEVDDLASLTEAERSRFIGRFREIRQSAAKDTGKLGGHLAEACRTSVRFLEGLDRVAE
jgi:hypothetical protein